MKLLRIRPLFLTALLFLAAPALLTAPARGQAGGPGGSLWISGERGQLVEIDRHLHEPRNDGQALLLLQLQLRSHQGQVAPDAVWLRTELTRIRELVEQHQPAEADRALHALLAVFRRPARASGRTLWELITRVESELARLPPAGRKALVLDIRLLAHMILSEYSGDLAAVTRHALEQVRHLVATDRLPEARTLLFWLVASVQEE